MSVVGPAAEGQGNGPEAAGGASDIDGLRTEVEHLKVEQAHLQAELAAKGPRNGHRRLRRTTTAALAGLCCVLVFLSALTVWVHQTVISTSGFVSTVGPIVEDPAVSQQLSVGLTNQIFTVVNVEGHIKQALPAGGQVIAAPLASAARGYVQNLVLKVLRSPQFRSVWRSVLRVTHSQIIAALRGQGNVLKVSAGAVVLNALPLVNAALQQVQSRASGLLGRNVTIPKITSGELPEQARAALSKALGVQLPANFAQIEVAKSDSLGAASNVVNLLDLAVWLLPLITLLVILATVWLSTTRRRTMLQILIGTAVALVVQRRVESWLESRIVASINPADLAASTAVVHQLFSGLITATLWLLVAALVAVAVLLVTGSYLWARGLRSRVAVASGGFVRAVGHRAGDQATVSWIVQHRRVLQAAGALVGGLLLLVVPGWWFWVVAAVLVAYEIALWRVGSTGPAASDESAMTPPPGTAPAEAGA